MKSIVHSSPATTSLFSSSSSFNNKYHNRCFNSCLPFLRTMANQQQHIVCAKSSNSNSKENKLWGGRFEESVTDAVERFTESISFDKALYKHDIMGSRAHASMLAHQVF